MRRICVFCGSSPGVRPAYAGAAVALARCLAEQRVAVVYGGGKTGLMGVLADAAMEAGAEVIGVIPHAIAAKEIAHTGLQDLRVVGSMHERKALMAELSDAFIALPGGYGTFEEFCEVLTWTQLGLQTKPCGLLNVDGYYDHLLALFDHAEEERFLKSVHRRIVIADDNSAALVARLLLQDDLPATGKWLDAKQS